MDGSDEISSEITGFFRSCLASFSTEGLIYSLWNLIVVKYEQLL